MAGDSIGNVHLLDPRASLGAASVACLPLHKKGTKVVSVSVHPRDPSLILTAGNDHTARLFDVRAISSNARGSAAGSSNGAGTSSNGAGTSGSGSAGAGSGAADAASPSTSQRRGASGPHSCELAAMQHPKVVNAAYFSPLTGNKILTTCQVRAGICTACLMHITCTRVLYDHALG